MAENRKPLDRVVGLVVGSDPAEQNTAKGPIVKFRVSQTRSYDQGDSQFIDVAVWNDALRPVVLKEVARGDQVVIEGNLKEPQGDFSPSISAFRVGTITWLRRETLEPAPDNF